jgi:hypothetical protein
MSEPMSKTDADAGGLALPEKPRGRPPASYYDELDDFADGLVEINRKLDFSMSARGWAYYLENEGHITKSEFDYAAGVINKCRKGGRLPVDFTAADDSRAFASVHDPNDTEPKKYIKTRLNRLANPSPSASFWRSQPAYIQVLVEKVDLRELFAPLCRKYNIPIATSKGWSSIRQRADMIARWEHWGRQELTPVLLYAGDFDPAGMQISDTLRSNFADLHDARIPAHRAGDGYITGWDADQLIIDRFGLNHDFIEDQGLEWIDNLETGGGKDLSSPSHPDHELDYVQNWLDKYGARKVEANALVTRPEAGRALFREAVERYLGPNPEAAQRDREREIANEIESRLDMAGLGPDMLADLRERIRTGEVDQ